MNNSRKLLRIAINDTWLFNSKNVCRFSTSNRKLNDKVYEYRAYYVKPEYVKSFVELSKQYMDIRMSHSKLTGYWISELGGINDMVHIWEYDSLSQRAGVRAGLAGDEAWMTNFIAKMMPWLIRQDNYLMKCLPGTDVVDPPNTGGVYELQMFSYHGKPLEDVSKSVQEITRSDATLLGSWYKIVGVLNTGFMLWHHPTPDNIVSSPYNGNPDAGKY
ncbi:hypothetical protein ACF0H5_006188 [Mactra antiquata]